MAKISTYSLADQPLQLSDRLIGTEAPRPVPSSTPLATRNFSLAELLQLFSSNFPAASLQAVLDTGNTAIQNINLTGSIYTTLIKPFDIEDVLGSTGSTFQFLSKAASGINWVNLPVDNLQDVLDAGNTATQNLSLIGNISSTIMIPGNIQDDVLSLGITGQVLSKSATGIKWINIPTSFTAGLNDVLLVGNTATNDIILTGDITVVDAHISGALYDSNNSPGTSGQILSSTVTGTDWINPPSSIIPSALTKVDDTNITLSLGGTPNTALLQGVSLTLGWTGTLADSRIASASIWNAKQDALSGTGLVKSVAGTISYITDNSINWDSAYTDRITSLTTTGTGAATLIGNVLNIPTPSSATFVSLTTSGSSGLSTLIGGVLNVPGYTLAGLGGVPTSRTLTINGTAYDLSADRTWNVGTVTSVSATSPITSSGGTTPTISTSMATNKLIGRSTAGTGVMEEITIGTGLSLSAGTLSNANSGTVTSVGLTMPTAFTVSNSPITGAGTIAVIGAAVASQYVRGDGTLANFPTSTGGGASVSYYLNGSVSQGTIGGVAYKEMNGTPIIGAGTDFTINADGYIAQFITDVGDPNKLLIPAGNWNFETYFSASSGGGSPRFYIELYKYNGATFTLIATNSATPEFITGGTNIDLYFTALAVPPTTLAITDRLAVRFYVIHSGRTITMHTENSHLSQVITTFSSGLTALNGLTSQVQYLAVGTAGTDFNISSATDTHTFNLPTASATNRGALSTTDWSAFNGKQNALTNPITGTGTTNYLPKFTGASVLGDSAAQDNGTSIIIEKAISSSSAAPLMTRNLTPYSAPNYNQFSQIWLNSGGGVMAYIRNDGTFLTTNAVKSNYHQGAIAGSASAPVFNFGDTTGLFFPSSTNIAFTTASAEKMRITSAGNVGIGTATPYSKFTTYGALSTSTSQISIVNSEGGHIILRTGIQSVANSGLSIISANVDGTSQNTRLVMTGAGNVGIGTTAPTARLHVAAPGALSTDIALRVRNSADTTDLFQVQGNGAIVMSSGASFYTLGNNLNFRSNLGGGSGFVLDAQSFNSLNSTNLEQGFGFFSGTYAPTSGTGTLNGLKITPTINQTGGANGITRGLFINPTLTAAADFRAIETTVGNVILGSTSGNVGIGVTVPETKLHIEDVTKVLTNNVAGVAQGTLSLVSTDAQAANVGTSLLFGGNYITGSQTRIAYAAITGRKANSSSVNADGYLSFLTWRSTGLTEAMRVTPAGYLGINTTTPAKLLDVNGDALINTLTVGKGAGNQIYNTVLGYQALGGNTTGNENVAIGYQALLANSTGGTNVGIGVAALKLNETGGDNTAVGTVALFNNTTGSGNTAIGYSALNASVDGYANTNIGSACGGLASSPIGTTLIGYDLKYRPSNLSDPLSDSDFAISQYWNEYPGKPHFYAPNKIVIGASTNTEILSVSWDTYNAFFVDYSFDDGGGNLRAGTIKCIFASVSGTFYYELTDDVTPDIGTTTNLSFDVIDDGSHNAVLRVLNSDAATYIRFTSRLLFKTI